MKTVTLFALLATSMGFAVTVSLSTDTTRKTCQSLSMALTLAAGLNEPATITLGPGIHAATSSVLVVAAPDLTIKGSGMERTVIVAPAGIRATESCILDGVHVMGPFSNASACAIVRNVRFSQPPLGSGIVGVYYDDRDGLHVSGLGPPRQDNDAVSWSFVSNAMAQVATAPGRMAALLNTNNNGIYAYVNECDAAVSNFARSYTDTATNALAQALASQITIEGGVTLTGDTLVIEAACAPPTPPPGAQDAALNASAPHSVYGEHVTASLNGEIAFVDLAIEGNSPAGIVVTSGRDKVPVASVARQVVDATWYRYELSPHVPIEAGNWYTIAFPNNAALELTCVDGGFAQGYAMTSTPNVDPGYDVQFRTLILEYVRETVSEVQITPGGIALSGDATLTVNNVPVATETSVAEAMGALEQTLAGDYVEKQNGEQTMQGPLRITNPPTEGQHAVTKEYLDAHFVPTQPEAAIRAPAACSQFGKHGLYPWDLPATWFRSEHDGYLAAYIAALPEDACSKTVRLTGWGYAIPSCATIVGLKARVVQRGTGNRALFFQLVTV